MVFFGTVKFRNCQVLRTNGVFRGLGTWLEVEWGFVERLFRIYKECKNRKEFSPPPFSIVKFHVTHQIHIFSESFLQFVKTRSLPTGFSSSIYCCALSLPFRSFPLLLKFIYLQLAWAKCATHPLICTQGLAFFHAGTGALISHGILLPCALALSRACALSLLQ